MFNFIEHCLTSDSPGTYRRHKRCYLYHNVDEGGAARREGRRRAVGTGECLFNFIEHCLTSDSPGTYRRHKRCYLYHNADEGGAARREGRRRAVGTGECLFNLSSIVYLRIRPEHIGGIRDAIYIIMWTKGERPDAKADDVRLAQVRACSILSSIVYLRIRVYNPSSTVLNKLGLGVRVNPTHGRPSSISLPPRDASPHQDSAGTSPSGTPLPE